MQKNKAEYMLATGMGRLICKLPLHTAYFIGKCIGLLFYYIIPIRKKVALANVSSSFPELSTRQVKTIVKNTYINMALNIIDFMRYPRITKSFILDHVKFNSKDILQWAAEQNKGAILMSGHFGNWEIMGGAISALGYSLIGAVKEQRNPQVGELINEYREMVGIESLSVGMGMRGVLKALRNKKFVVLVADQDAHSSGVFVDFLGRPSSTAPGPATLALRTGAPIVFGSCVRNKKGAHTAHLQIIDHSDLDGATPENIQILTQRHATALEASIRRWPDHWLWMHKRWKTKPPAEKSNPPNADSL